jgi:thymidylate synthase
MSEYPHGRPIRSQYEDFMRHVFTKGMPKHDRTGTGTVSVFGYQMRFDFAEGFPLVTTKRVHFPSVAYELLWFLRGDRNVGWLQEHGVTIWDEWADEEGDLGPIYGVQWRSWPAPDGRTIDQIAETVRLLREEPDSRRILVSAWNVAELEGMALMPCHVLFQLYVAPGEGDEPGRLSCQVYQRSADVFLGVPFNIASYALLTHMLAQQCDLAVGDLVWTGGDCHIYDNHREQVETQLARAPYPYPTLRLLRRRPSIFEYAFEDFEVVGYEHHPPIRAWESLPERFQPRPGRRNVVVTRNPAWSAEGAERARSLEEAFRLLEDEPRVFVVGGAELYTAALPLADELLLTEIDTDVDGDTFFPAFARSEFQEVHRERRTSDDGTPFAFVTYERGVRSAEQPAV